MSDGLPGTKSAGQLLTQYKQNPGENAALLDEAIRVSAEAEEWTNTLSTIELDADGRIDARNLGGVWRLAKLLASTELIPVRWQGKPKEVFVIAIKARELDLSLFNALAHIYIVHKQPGLETQLAVALLAKSKLIVGVLEYEFSGEGDEYGCTCSAKVKESGQVVSRRITIADAKKAGWYAKKDSWWPKNHELMCGYRAAMWLIRKEFPQVLMGWRSVDELRDSDPEPASQEVVSDLLGGDEAKSHLEQAREASPVPGPVEEKAKTPEAKKAPPKKKKPTAEPTADWAGLSPEPFSDSWTEQLSQLTEKDGVTREEILDHGDVIPRGTPGNVGRRLLAAALEDWDTRNGAKGQ